LHREGLANRVLSGLFRDSSPSRHGDLPQAFELAHDFTMRRDGVGMTPRAWSLRLLEKTMKPDSNLPWPKLL
jgi:hypothetical protein